jgi:hypothetical protein
VIGATAPITTAVPSGLGRIDRQLRRHGRHQPGGRTPAIAKASPSRSGYSYRQPDGGVGRALQQRAGAAVSDQF